VVDAAGPTAQVAGWWPVEVVDAVGGVGVGVGWGVVSVAGGAVAGAFAP
jgi:hypothetical protein